MSRRQRGARQVAAFQIPYECPDCDNNVELRYDESGVPLLVIRHDDSCPWLAAHETNRR